MKRGLVLALFGMLFPWLPASSTLSAAEPKYDRAADIIYGRKFGTALTMDVFKPKQDGNGLGVILVVSGGWFSNHDTIPTGFVDPLVGRGYTIFAVVHGSQPKFTIPEIVQDMNRAVRFIRFHAKDYGIDPDRIGIYGASAGGHLSLMQGTAGDEGNPKAKDPVDQVSSRVQAVACFFPPTDFLNYGKPGEEALGTGILENYKAPFDFHEFDAKRKAFVPVEDHDAVRKIGQRISPITHVTPDDPPTLILHGDADKLVPIQQAEMIVEKFKGAGVEAKLVVKSGAVHGWPEMAKDCEQIADWFDEHLKEREGAGDAKSCGAAPDPAKLPEPWAHQDIGEVAVSGDASLVDGVLTITGTLDIWGRADGFHFAYRPLDGDGEVVARVTAVENTNNHAKAGVMFRESLEAGSRHATMVVTPVDGVQFLRRKQSGGLTTNTNPGRNRGKLPYWVKLVREGDSFRAYESVDGADWVLAGTDTVALGKKAYVGLVSSSHQKTVTNTSKIDHVNINP